MPPYGYRGSLEERFWGRVQRSTPDCCWEWTGGTNDRGYGQIGDGDRILYAHRLSYEWYHNVTLERSDIVRHTCDNPPCVNPHHLLIGTHQDNSDDKMRRGRDRKALGTENGRSKLTPAQALEIDALIREGGMSLRAISRQFGIGVNTVIALKKGITWAHVTGR